MAQAVLLIGGNLGDRHACMERACEMICAAAGPVVAKSQLYETAPWGFESGDMFLNQALVVETELSPHELLDTLQGIEKALGRKRDVHAAGTTEGEAVYSSRTMDIDIIFYDDLVMESERLTIPHPLAHLRNFVLIPLKEIIPDFTHPVTGQKISEMYENI